MASLSVDLHQNRQQPQLTRIHSPSGSRSERAVVEEIQGLIRVYGDGQVERFPIVPIVPCTSAPVQGLNITSRDLLIDVHTNLWARIYVPSYHHNCNTTSRQQQQPPPPPLLVYFHGGGFCVGSSAWSCYHDFLVRLSYETNCVVLSVNYRLAPESRLPVAYDDGFKSVMWLKQQALGSNYTSNVHSWWASNCDFSRLFLGGDSAGANIAHNVAIRLGATSASLKPLNHRGTVLIQPFFGGETRTASERAPQPPGTALSLQASDSYWRLALPVGSNRDHPWCNCNVGSSSGGVVLPSTLVFVSDMDILKDRNVDFCNTMASTGKHVQLVLQRGVGHAFHILHNSPCSHSRLQEMMSHVKGFIHK